MAPTKPVRPTPRPPPSALARRPAPELRTYLLWSAAGHAVLVAAALILSMWVPSARIDLDQKPIHATLVRRGQARDAKLLPRVEETPPPPPPQSTAMPLPGPKPPPSPAARPQQSQTDDGSRRSRLFDAFSKTSKKARDEPLEGAADGDPEGNSATQEGDPYFGLIDRNVHRYYNVSSAIPESERRTLKALVWLRLTATGAVDSAKIQMPSGNALFDNAVLAAVKRAAPFPPPPAHLLDELVRKGVTMEFTP
ncbi:MAG TPA: TonB family protein [Myxococcaceae bacterium]|nr:TonB family protein [Myxococcaceae bacterium]